MIYPLGTTQVVHTDLWRYLAVLRFQGLFLPLHCYQLLDQVAVGVVVVAAVAAAVVIGDVAAVAEYENVAAVAVEAEIDALAVAEGDHVEAVPFVGGVMGVGMTGQALAQKLQVP